VTLATPVEKLCPVNNAITEGTLIERTPVF